MGLYCNLVSNRGLGPRSGCSNHPNPILYQYYIYINIISYCMKFNNIACHKMNSDLHPIKSYTIKCCGIIWNVIQFHKFTPYGNIKCNPMK